MSSDCCEPVVITTSSALDVEPARLQPLRDRLAQRPVALRVVVARHPLAQHRARALGDPLGRQQLGIDEHRRQRDHAARRRNRAATAAAARTRGSGAATIGAGAANRVAASTNTPSRSRASTSPRATSSSYAACAVFFDSPSCFSSARTGGSRLPGRQRAARDLALHARDDVGGGRATIGDGDVQADVGRRDSWSGHTAHVARPRRDSTKKARGTAACYDFQVVKIVTSYRRGAGGDGRPSCMRMTARLQAKASSSPKTAGSATRSTRSRRPTRSSRARVTPV